MTDSIDGEQAEGHCHDVLKSMYLFLDGEGLTDSERSEIREHLDDCSPCLESFEFEAELKQIIRQRCSDNVPLHVYEKVRAKLSVEIESTAPKPAES